jgi:hypothetical protein
MNIPDYFTDFNQVSSFFPYGEEHPALEELEELLKYLQVKRSGMYPGACNGFNADIADGFLKGVFSAIHMVIERIETLKSIRS